MDGQARLAALMERVKIFRKYWIHFVIWGAMVLYLAFAHQVYSQFFVKNGTPIRINGELPVLTDKIHGHIDYLKPAVFEGQVIFNLTGWAFSTDDPGMGPEQYERQIVLICGERNYFFSMDSYPRPDVQNAFATLDMKLTQSGFHVQISPDRLNPGTYRIGLIFIDPRDGTAKHNIIKHYLVRTPNQLQLAYPDESG